MLLLIVEIHAPSLYTSKTLLDSQRVQFREFVFAARPPYGGARTRELTRSGCSRKHGPRTRELNRIYGLHGAHLKQFAVSFCSRPRTRELG
jgi:hypothetical protein